MRGWMMTERTLLGVVNGLLHRRRDADQRGHHGGARRADHGGRGRQVVGPVEDRGLGGDDDGLV